MVEWNLQGATSCLIGLCFAPMRRLVILDIRDVLIKKMHAMQVGKADW
jgi:hypothetical protein